MTTFVGVELHYNVIKANLRLHVYHEYNVIRSTNGQAAK